MPNWSCTFTVTAGLIAEPAVVVLGWTPNASLFAAAAFTVKVLEVAPVSDASLAVRVLAAPEVVGLIALKVATPLTAAIVSVLPVKAVVLLPIVTLLVSLVTVLPN